MVYVISNEAGKTYIGHTNDFEQRLKRHNGILKSKSRSYTRKQGGKWKLIYSEMYGNRTEAMQREKQLKSFRGRVFIKSQIEG